MPTGVLPAAGKIKRKYAKKNRKKDKTKKLLKQVKNLVKQQGKQEIQRQKKKALELWMCDNIKKELIELTG